MSALPRKQNVAEMKLRRLTENNARLEEELNRRRIKVSEASQSLIDYCNNTRDPLVPSVWGTVDKKDDPYAPQQAAVCECAIM